MVVTAKANAGIKQGSDQYYQLPTNYSTKYWMYRHDLPEIMRSCWVTMATWLTKT